MSKMLESPRTGTVAQRVFLVEPHHAIDFSSAGLPPVLSTPSLIWFLEHAALDAALPALEPGEITVGVHVDVEHLAATPLGQRVTCTARLVRIDGSLLSFQVEARDEHELIARGFHKRRAVIAARMAKRIEAKRNPPS